MHVPRDVCTCVFFLASVLCAMYCVGVALVLAAGEQLMTSISAASGFSLDTDLGGAAVLAYRSAATSKITLCIRSVAATWLCRESAQLADASAVPSVTYTRDAFLVVWSVGSAIHTMKLSRAGEVLNAHSSNTASEVQGVVSTVCNLVGDGSVALGKHTNNKLAYAFTCTTSALLHI